MLQTNFIQIKFNFFREYVPLKSKNALLIFSVVYIFFEYLIRFSQPSLALGLNYIQL